MLGHSSDNHDWLLADAITCVSCGFHLRNARKARNASDCVWMEIGLYSNKQSHCLANRGTCVWTTCPGLLREAERPGLEHATSRLQVRRPNHYAITPHLPTLFNLPSIIPKTITDRLNETSPHWHTGIAVFRAQAFFDFAPLYVKQSLFVVILTYEG